MLSSRSVLSNQQVQFLIIDIIGQVKKDIFIRIKRKYSRIKEQDLLMSYGKSQSTSGVLKVLKPQPEIRAITEHLLLQHMTTSYDCLVCLMAYKPS